MSHKIKFVLLFLLILSFSLSAQPLREAQLESSDRAIVASTSWVGGIVEAAGAKEVNVLAPVELRHPPEYDFAPNDIIKASQANYIFWAGYEGFIKNLTKAANIDEKNIHLVATNNAPDKLVVSVENVAKILNTQKEYEEWKIKLEQLALKITKNAKEQNTNQLRAVVQFHQKDFATYLGYDVVYVFGPQDLTLGDIREIESLKADIIIDNYHSAQGESFALDNRQYVQLINFPGPFGSKTILDVVSYNAKALGLLDD